MGNRKSWPTYIAAIAGSVLAVFGGIKTWQTSQLFMPEEYKTIKRVFNKLAAKNDLGDRPITFIINTGSKANWLAEELSLCKEDECNFYGELNPFESYIGESSKDINEIIRQAYLFNGIEGYAWSHGVILISRSSFQSYQGKDNFFACLLGHELSHVLNDDIFKDNLREGREGKNLKEKKREILSNSISRESESNADLNASKMIINAGLPRNTCLDEYDFRARHEGLGEETKEDSTHPGYDDRRAAMINFLKSYNPNSEDELRGKTTGKWKYNRDLNTLRFIPGSQ